MSRARLRQALLLAIVLLYAVSIPWYRSSDAEPARWLGLPDWVAVAVLCYLAIAALNFVAWRITEIDDAPPRGGAGGPPEGGA